MSADVCAVCEADHADLGGQAGCGNPAHGHRLLYHGTQGSRVLYRCPAHKCPVTITTPKNPEPVKGETMSAQPAIHHPLPPPPQTDLAIRDDQQRWDKYQLAGLRQLGIHDAPNADLAVFFHYCKAHRLDPFSRQVTMIKRRDRGTDKWTIQTEIDGYRLISKRAANRDGQKISYMPTIWVDADLNEYEYWVADAPPAMARVTVLVDGAPFHGYAAFREFVQLKDGKPTSMWLKMPANQLAKCAEAQALRKAFPSDLEGTQITEEDTRAPAPPWHVAAAVQPQPVPAPAGPGRNRAVAGVLGQWQRLGIGDDDEILNLTAALAGTDTVLDNVADLPTPQLEALTVLLERCEDISQVHALLEGGDAPGDDAACD
jgi:phage recombination protein Bet